MEDIIIDPDTMEDVAQSTETDIAGNFESDHTQQEDPRPEPEQEQEPEQEKLEPRQLYQSPTKPEKRVLEEKITNGFSHSEDNPKLKSHTEKHITVVGLQPEITSSPSKKRLKTHSSSSDQQQSSQQASEIPTPRLVIDRLALINFKSYAGRQIVGPFHPSFSAVVGPNGSGKSNVIDSLLFVFGFRATKMRQSKLSELIHNSENFQNLPFCQVDIFFKMVVDGYDSDGNPKTSDIPNSELVVSRKAFRNNSSKYYINEREKSYTEVTTLLKAQGIDLDHKRFLILQGEVESIAQMKPKAESNSDDGLLEYLEDIIGTSKYKQSIEEGTLKVDDLNDVCVEKEQRFKITEKAKNELEPPKANAIDFLKKEKDVIIKKSYFLQYSLMKDTEILEHTTASLKEVSQELKKEDESRSAFVEEVNVLKKKHEDILHRIKATEEEVESLKKVHKKIEKSKVTLDEKMKYLEGKKKKATKTLETGKLGLREAQTSLGMNESNLIEYESQIGTLSEQLETEKSALEEIKMELADKTKEISVEIDKLQAQLQPWKHDIDTKDGEIAIKQSEINTLIAKLETMRKEITYSSNRMAEIVDLIKSKEKQINFLRKEQAHTNEQILLGEPEVKDAESQLKSMETELLNARQKTEDARSRVSSVNTRNKVLAALTHMRDSGRLKGFYGRLGDLGVIDDQYDIAVSTGGGSLDDMVVDTVEVAQQCISYMRKNNLGFGKFIILDKLRKFNLSRVETPNRTPRLFDLITASSAKFAPAFYSSMYDTLVASNLQEANKVAFGGRRRWRVVTLDGKLVDTSGTLSGGGSRFFRGAMRLASSGSANSDVSEFELEKLITEVQQKDKAFSIASAAFAEMEAALNSFKERQPEIEMEISKLEIETRTLKEESLELKRRLNNATANKNAEKQLEVEISGFQNQVKKLEQVKEKLRENSQGLEKQIEDLQQKIMDIGGVKLKMQKSKVDSVLQKLEIVNERLQSDSLQVSKLKKQINKFTQQISSNEHEIEESDLSIAEIKQEYEEQASAFHKSEKKIEELTFIKDELVEESEAVKEELNDHEAKLNELRKGELELRNKIEIYESQIRGCKDRIAQIKEEKGLFSFRDVSEYLTWLEDGDELLESLKQDENEIPVLTKDELEDMDMKEVCEEVERNERFLEETHTDLDVLKVYSKRYQEYNERRLDLNESVTKRDSVKQSCEDLKKKRLDEFMTGFNEISNTLKEMYQMITMGGNAELELVDSLDPFSEGIAFSVMPPKKSWKTIANLSGGEKTLSSLALVFALHRYKPTPLYVMDEIDAALDFRNVSIVANYIKERTKNAQFIVISLRNNMFELAQQLVGIYKVNNMTKSITLQNKEIIS